MDEERAKKRAQEHASLTGKQTALVRTGGGYGGGVYSLHDELSDIEGLCERTGSVVIGYFHAPDRPTAKEE